MGTLPTTVQPGDLGHCGDHQDIHTLLADIAIGPDFNTVARWGTGTKANRPSAGRFGSVWLATDDDTISVDNGAVWMDLSEFLSLLVVDLVTSTVAGLVLPACRVGKSAPQSIPNDGATFTAVTWNDETGPDFYDQGALHDIASNTARFTASRDGEWEYHFGVRWDADADGYRRLQVTKNGSSAYVGGDERISAGGINMTQNCSGKVYLDAGEFIQLGAAANAGGSIDIKDVGSVASFKFSTEIA